MIDISNSSKIFVYFQNGISFQFYERLPFYEPNSHVTRGTVLILFRYVSFPYKPIEHEFIQFHSFVDQVSHNSRLDTQFSLCQMG